ncbi:MAG: efflux RND transporter periplasmic adaptor subunit [Acidobacteriia bacterium]|nr:efflux RND transporter periplasmic adaptor subunit [Terriglobia bacterium]
MLKEKITGVALVTAVGLTLAFSVYHRQMREALGLTGVNATSAAADPAPGQETTHKAAPGEKKILYWQDPMHPAFKSDKPGKAPDCGMDLVPVYAEGGGPEGEMPSGTTQITAQKQQLIGVQYGQAALRPLVRTIRAVGRLSYDETKITHIHTKFDGWISKVYVDFTGQLIRKGQPLFTVYSPELVSTQQEYLIAKRAHKYLSDAPYAEVSEGANSLLDSARERLKLWDISDAQIDELDKTGKVQRDLTMYSPVNGFVLDRKAFENVRVTADTDLYTIAYLSTVWANAEVYEYEVPYVRLGQKAIMSLSYYPGEAFKGKVSYIYPQLDTMTRTLKVRLDFPNSEFKLKPDMYADIQLQIDYGTKLVVPQDAVLDSGTEQVVFVARGDGYFEPRKVEVGPKIDDSVVILSGLKAGEKIVTSGNFLVDSESRLKTAMGQMAGMKMEGQKEAPKASKPGTKMEEQKPKPKETMPDMKM